MGKATYEYTIPAAEQQPPPCLGHAACQTGSTVFAAELSRLSPSQLVVASASGSSRHSAAEVAAEGPAAAEGAASAQPGVV